MLFLPSLSLELELALPLDLRIVIDLSNLVIVL